MADKLKRITALLLALLLTVSLAACGGSGDGEGGDDDFFKGVSAGKELTQSSAADDVFTLNCNKAYSFNPIRATNISNQLVCGFVYENMLDVDNSYNLKKGLITDWSTEDGGQTWKFTVTTDRVFHSGQKLTAADVAYSLKCAIVSDRFEGRFGCVAAVSANDGQTFTVQLNGKNMQFPMRMTVPVIRSGSGNDTFPDGTGPYTFAGDANSLIAFEKYPGSAALPIDKIYLKEYDTIEATLSAYEDSLIDMVLNDPSAGANLGYGNANAIRAYNTTNMHYIGFNLRSGIMANDAVRCAVSYAFDREYLVNQLGGYASEAVFPINQASWLYNVNLAMRYDYSLEMVQQILGAANIKDYDGNGYLELPVSQSSPTDEGGIGSNDIVINLIVFGESAAKVNMAQHFASEMDKLGIKVNVKKLGWDLYNATLNAGTYDMYYAEVKMTADFDMSALLAEGGSLNYGGIKDTELEKLMSIYASVPDSERKTAVENLCMYIANKAYIVPLCFERHQLISHRGVIEGIKANENNPVGNSYDWTIKIEKLSTSDKVNGDKK